MASDHSTSRDLFGEPVGEPVKRCGRCGQTKPISEFYPDRKGRGKFGVTAKCRKCMSEYSALYHHRKVAERGPLPPREYLPTPVAGLPPFPPDIDRVAFGHWISGFCAGESCFDIRHNKRTGSFNARFNIKLRGDELPTLQLVQSYWQCGIISNLTSPTYKNPQIDFTVTRLGHLSGVLIPHFEAFPLHAKKAQDFAIWKVGVEIIIEVSQRPASGRGFKKGKGQAPKWTDKDRQRLLDLKEALRQRRVYGATLRLPPSAGQL